MLTWPILSVIAFLPLAGALLIAALPSHGEAEERNVRWIAVQLATMQIGRSAAVRITNGSEMPSTPME